MPGNYKVEYQSDGEWYGADPAYRETLSKAKEWAETWRAGGNKVRIIKSSDTGKVIKRWLLPKMKANPNRRSVSLKNFTGTAKMNPDGSVTLRESGAGKKRTNPHRLTGWVAIEYAEKHGGTLKKFADPTERALKRVTIDKARRIAREDARLIYMDVKHGNR